MHAHTWLWLSLCHVSATIMTIFEVFWLARVLSTDVPFSQQHLETAAFVILVVTFTAVTAYACFRATHRMTYPTGSGPSSSYRHGDWRILNYTVLGSWPIGNLVAALILTPYRFMRDPSPICVHYAEFDRKCIGTTIASVIGFPAAGLAALSLYTLRMHHREEMKTRHTDVERTQHPQVKIQPRESISMEKATTESEEYHPFEPHRVTPAYDSPTTRRPQLHVPEEGSKRKNIEEWRRGIL